MAKYLYRVDELTRAIFDDGKFPKKLRRVGIQSAPPEEEHMVNLYRVVLQIECDDKVVVHQMGQDYLEQIRNDAQEGDYLASYIEHELGWAEQSFNRIEVEEIKRLESLPPVPE